MRQHITDRHPGQSPDLYNIYSQVVADSGEIVAIAGVPNTAAVSAVSTPAKELEHLREKVLELQISLKEMTYERDVLREQREERRVERAAQEDAAARADALAHFSDEELAAMGLTRAEAEARMSKPPTLKSMRPNPWTLPRLTNLNITSSRAASRASASTHDFAASMDVSVEQAGRLSGRMRGMRPSVVITDEGQTSKPSVGDARQLDGQVLIYDGTNWRAVGLNGRKA